MDSHEIKDSAKKTWLIIFLLLAVILAQSLFSLFIVGDMGPPTWSYRPLKDVPGESSYAIYKKLPYPQHVRGAGGE